MSKLIELLPETIELLAQQLRDDAILWGDVWRARPRDGQEERIMEKFINFYNRYKCNGVPIPWTRMLGMIHVALMREEHPELLSDIDLSLEEVR